MIVESLTIGTITLTQPKPEPIELWSPVTVTELVLEPEIPELEVVAFEPLKPRRLAEGGSNTYYVRQCTWWVKEWKPDVSNKWGNANTWDERAARDGWIVSLAPIVGAVAQSDRGGYGHVALVESVNPDGTVTIREGNYDYNGSVRTKTVPVGQYEYIY